MSLLELLADEEAWNLFYEHKLSLACPKQFTGELRRFIAEKRYIPVCGLIASGQAFPLPKRSVISKMGSEKKRIVYTYPEDAGTVIKLLTFLMLRKYDHIFDNGLYSFRHGRTAQDAVRSLLKDKRLPQMYGYKVDIHDYFNSIPVGLLLPMLEKTLADDKELYDFLASLLNEPNVEYRGRVITEKKGIMAGTPISSFYANLFLAGLDSHFSDAGIPYARYSDDIILFAPDPAELEEHIRYIHEFLKNRHLSVNPAKEEHYKPGEAFTFLGFRCADECVDIAPQTVKKLKQKMHRKRDALMRWSKRNDVAGVKAASAFIRIFNRKLLESPRDNELSWSNWFFPVINTADSLHQIDLYAQDCLRYLMSGRHTKARYNIRYEDLKGLGYRSLVHEFYRNQD